MDSKTEKRLTQQELLCSHYARCGSVTESAEVAGIYRRTHYDWLEKDDAYRERFDDARQQWIESMVAEAYRRAVTGWHDGEKKRYSDRLLLRLLSAYHGPEFGERVAHSGDEEKPIQHRVTVEYEDDWYGTSSEAAETSEASEERAAQLRAFQAAHLRPEMGQNGNGSAGHA